jgi:hypothetical protein
MFQRRQPCYRPDGGDEIAGGAAPGSVPAEEVAALDLVQLRELVLLAHPDVIPELVTGTTFAELIGSVEPARAAYQRAVDAIRKGQPAEAAAPKIPAGGGQRTASVNVEQLSPAAKISEGLRRRGSQARPGGI